MFLVCYFLRPCAIRILLSLRQWLFFSSHSLSLSLSHSCSHSPTFYPHSHAGIRPTSSQSEREIDDPNERSFGGSSKFDLPFAIRHVSFVDQTRPQLFGEATIPKGDVEFFLSPAFICRSESHFQSVWIAHTPLLLCFATVIVEIALIIASRSSGYDDTRGVSIEIGPSLI